MRQDVGNGEALCMERHEAFCMERHEALCLERHEALFEGEDLVVVRREEATEVVEEAFDAVPGDGGWVQVIQESRGSHVPSRSRVGCGSPVPERGVSGWVLGNVCLRERVLARMAYEIGGTGRESLQGQNEGSVEFDDSSEAGSVESRLSSVRTLVEDVVHSGEGRFTQDVKVDGKIWRVVVEPVSGL